MSLDLCAWEHFDHYWKDGRLDEETMRSRLGKAADAGIRTLYLLPYKHGSVPQPREFRTFLETCRDLGMGCHVWIIPFESEELERKLEKRLTDAEHWETCEERFYPCLNDEKVRDASLPATERFLAEYKGLFTGIHLDYIRDDNAVGSLICPCECQACRSLRLRYFGKELLSKEERANPAAIYKEFAWKNANVTALVRKYRAMGEFPVLRQDCGRYSRASVCLPEESLLHILRTDRHRNHRKTRTEI